MKKLSKKVKFILNTKINKMRIRIFLQFAFILCLLTATVLLIARPFFYYVIEDALVDEIKASFCEIEEAYDKGEKISDIVRSIEVRNDIILEIYQKSPSGKYDDIVFCQRVYGVYDTDDSDTHADISLLDFANNDFEINRSYSDTTAVGSLVNADNHNKYFVVSKQSNDSKLLFVSALNYSVFDGQIKILYSAIFIIICFLLILIIITVYIYITKVTNPLKKITAETLEMASTQNENLRVTARKSHAFFTEIDSLIIGINKMYVSLLQTKSALINELCEKEKKEKQKNDMLSAISHELKTPITIILGYTEGIPYIKDNQDTLTEYTDTIMDECARLNNLVMNLLTYLKIGNDSFTDNSHEFDIKDFIESQLTIYQPVFNSKQITFTNQINRPLYGFADEELLKYVINNIISNAVSYIDGERQIIISYEDIGNFYRIYVFNSGKGIDPVHIDRIWESFYREDAARIQDDGHFGLGLSIIKGIQELHGCAYGVQNAEGGVEFWFDIKKFDTTAN